MSAAREIGFLITDVKRMIRRQYLKQDMSVTPMQARALVYVSRNEGIRQVSLAEILEIQPIATARLIDQLSEDGLVERRPDPTDRRAYGLYLADGAQARLDEIDLFIEDVSQKAVAGMSEQDVEQLTRLLSIMHQNLLDKE